MRWSDERVLKFLEANTTAAKKILSQNDHPGVTDIIRLHLARGGWKDHLLAFWLVMPTFGVSAWVWNRCFASCQFVGFLDKETGRVGCLAHPRRVGYPDCRRHAFPLIPTAGCNRRLRCPMLDSKDADLSWGNVKASREGWKSLKSWKKGCTMSCFFSILKKHYVIKSVRRRISCERGDVLMEYVIITTLIVLPLIAGGQMLFDPAGSPFGNFGLLGNVFVRWYQRIMCGIGLPIP